MVVIIGVEFRRMSWKVVVVYPKIFMEDLREKHENLIQYSWTVP
jgi:hypothetical protein